MVVVSVVRWCGSPQVRYPKRGASLCQVCEHNAQVSGRGEEAGGAADEDDEEEACDENEGPGPLRPHPTHEFHCKVSLLDVSAISRISSIPAKALSANDLMHATGFGMSVLDIGSDRTVAALQFGTNSVAIPVDNM